ncbi:hypothetical protein T492DRAFT_1090326 [Pavlovales sp. CCMP2436]|nr:hypothetical protein T492DRAFT_1090326 [Pavlovales sp. CCMP2436]
MAPSEAWGHPEFNGPLGLQLPILRQFCALVRAAATVPEARGGFEHLVPFCFPDRLPLPDRSNGGLCSYLHTFACERPDGGVDHAACLTTAFPNPEAGPGAWTPVCVLLASRQPLYRVSLLFLQQLADEHRQHGRLLPAGAELQDQLGRMVGALEALSAHSDCLFADGLHPRLPLLPLLRALRWQTDTLVRVWLACLLEGHVLLGSHDAAVRNVAVHGLTALLLPFDFPGYVLPMLPTADGGADYAPFLCHSPSPYLVGCDALMLARVRASTRDVSTLDLDAGKFAPAAHVARLHEQLLATPVLLKLRALLRLHASSERGFDETELRALFLAAALSLADPLSDDGALGGSRSTLDGGVVRHWKLLSSTANVLQRRVLKLAAAARTQLDEPELLGAFRLTKLGYLPELCAAELQRASASGVLLASVVDGGASEHSLPLVAEVTASLPFALLHGGGAELPDNFRGGAAERCGLQTWRATSRWARETAAVYVRLCERTVVLQLLGHTLLTHVLRAGVRVRLPAGTWVPLGRRGGQRGAQGEEAKGEEVTDSHVADFRRNFAVDETPVAEYACVLTNAAGRTSLVPALVAAAGARNAEPGKLFITADSLCYSGRGPGGGTQQLRIPLTQIRRVEKTGGGPFAQRGLAVHTEGGGVVHFSSLPSLGQERAFAFVQYLQANAMERARALQAAAVAEAQSET